MALEKLYEKLYDWLIERGLSLAESEYSLVTGVEAEIKKLRRTTERIQALLTDADERRYIEDDSVHLWLRHLKDVGFDADDLLDDYQTDLNTSKLRTDRKRKPSWHYSILPSLTADPILLKRRRISKSIAEIKDRLDHIHKERDDFGLRKGDARRRISARGDPPVPQAMRVSYNNLPLHLKQCFRYCSIFPDGYEFDKDELVKLWIAEGFIQPTDTNDLLEIIGGNYFDDLLWRSFFQNSDTNDQSKQKYKMPNLIHDLAQSVSIYECLRMEHQAGHRDSRNPRYTSISHRCIDDKVFSELCAYENLRTLLLYSECNMPWKRVVSGIFDKFRCLRTLDLKNSLVEELPNSIGDLKHLRYIGLYNTKIRRLPDSICSLYNLQTLELGKCYRLLELPNNMSNLVNLRHLGLHIDWDKEADLISMPPNIGRLTDLQTLSRFIVTSGSRCGVEGFGIGELKDLNLRGELCITKLENVVNVGDAGKANLNQKQYIEILMLKWSAITDTSAQGAREEDVIERLRPHSNLRNLWIENYNGIDFPSWIGDPSFTCLESLTLSCCKGCRILPQLGQLPKLKNLYLKEMEELESIFSIPPALAKLELRNCRRLTTPPPVLHSLHDLIVEGGNEVTLRWITSLTTLSSLTISRFQGLERASGSPFQSLTALKKLKIEKCDKLVSLAEEGGLQNLTSLNSLEILSCPELKSLPGKLHLLASLHRLEIRAVPKLTSIPVEGLPVGLQNLVINGCPLLEQRYGSDGDDRPSIEHIPVLDIGS